jgi:hypothetical protein
MTGFHQFCFSSGEAIRAKGRAARSGATGKRADKAGVRRAETRRAGQLWPNAVGFRLYRAPGTAFIESLDLGPKLLWQNGSIQS